MSAKVLVLRGFNAADGARYEAGMVVVLSVFDLGDLVLNGTVEPVADDEPTQQLDAREFRPATGDKTGRPVKERK